MELAFDELVETEADYLFRYARRHFPLIDVAEDLVQESFLAAIENASSFRGECSPRTWLLSILRHKIIDKIRKNIRESSGEGAGSEDQLDRFFNERGRWREEKGPRAFKVTPESEVAQREFMEVLQGCLTCLPARLRHVFLLREVDGLAPDEICRQLGLSAAHVRVLLHRCRIQLRDCLQMHWIKQNEGP